MGVDMMKEAANIGHYFPLGVEPHYDEPPRVSNQQAPGDSSAKQEKKKRWPKMMMMIPSCVYEKRKRFETCV